MQIKSTKRLGTPASIDCVGSSSFSHRSTRKHSNKLFEAIAFMEIGRRFFLWFSPDATSFKSKPMGAISNHVAKYSCGFRSARKILSANAIGATSFCVSMEPGALDRFGAPLSSDCVGCSSSGHRSTRQNKTNCLKLLPLWNCVGGFSFGCRSTRKTLKASQWKLHSIWYLSPGAEVLEIGRWRLERRS